MNDSDIINSFFNHQNLNTSKNKLTFNGIVYERLFVDYYYSLFNAFKSKIPVELPESKIIGHSKWEPLLRAGHHGWVLTLMQFIPSISTNSEIGKLMACFDILGHHGMGKFELGLAPKDCFMKIDVTSGLEDSAFEFMDEKPEHPLCPFTAGMVLASFNLSMTTWDISKINSDSVEKMYQESPDIIQVKYGVNTGEESGFTLKSKS